MSKQFAKKSIAAVLTTAALAFAAASPVRAANQSGDWFEQQRSLTDGTPYPLAASPRPDKGAGGRVGEPAVTPQGEACSNQERQLRDAFFSSDGTPYTGAQDTALYLHWHRSVLVTATTSVLSQESAEGYDAVCLNEAKEKGPVHVFA